VGDASIKELEKENAELRKGQVKWNPNTPPENRLASNCVVIRKDGAGIPFISHSDSMVLDKWIYGYIELPDISLPPAEKDEFEEWFHSKFPHMANNTKNRELCRQAWEAAKQKEQRA
jgi:hypothetical protein